MATAEFRPTLLRDCILALACLGALGCGSDPDTVRLDVLLPTEYRPGIDFVEAHLRGGSRNRPPASLRLVTALTGEPGRAIRVSSQLP